MNDHMKNSVVTVDDKLKIHGGKFDGFCLKRFDIEMERPAYALVILSRKDENITTDISIQVPIHNLLLRIVS